jgi:hypothetical protein
MSMIGKKVPNNYFNISRILGKAAINFWNFLAFFMDNLKTFRQCYKNIVIIRSFIYCIYQWLTPKGRRPFFGPFLDIGQAIVDAIFVQKIWIFWWTCGLVLASRRTNFYKIPIFGYTNMPQKHFFFVKRAALGSQKTF